MKALLIVAHGSRKKESNDEIAHLSEKIRTKAPDSFDLVSYAFIQFATPLVPDVIDQLVEDGAKEMIVMPFFIAAGSHVAQDIPQFIDKARKKYPDVTFSLTRHLGKFEGIIDLILSEVK